MNYHKEREVIEHNKRFDEAKAAGERFPSGHTGPIRYRPVNAGTVNKRPRHKTASMRLAALGRSL